MKHEFSTSRRHVLGGSVAAAAWLALPPWVHAQERSLKVGVYGGFFKDTFDEHIFPEFTKATGIAVDSVSEPTGEAWLVQLTNAARAKQAPADVSMMAQVPRLKGRQQGLWQELDAAKLGNAKYLHEHFVQRDGDGRIDGIGAVSWYINLVTNTEAYPQAPESWKALWDPANKDRIGLLALASNSFLLDVTAKTWFGGPEPLEDQDGIKEVFEKLAEVKPNVRLWYRDEAQFQQALQSGEIPMGQYYHDVTGIAAAKGAPVRSTFPQEGGILDSGSWSVIKTSQKMDEALVFMDYMCQPGVQDEVARTLGSAPTVQRRHLKLSDEEFARVASEISPIVPKYDMYVDRPDWIADTWTAMLTG